MTEPVRLGLVGTGAIARAYGEALAGCAVATLAAACDTDATALSSFAKQMNCVAYLNLDEMLSYERLDGVIICTPPATHEAIAIAAIENGKHVLCEKPLTIDTAGAWRIVSAARRHGVMLTMASKFRFVEDVRRARDLLTSQTIGELVLIENSFTSRVDMSSRWNSNPRLSGGGVLIDNGTHAVDLLRFFMGQLCDVQIFEGRRVQSVDVEDTVRLFVRNADGAIGTSDLSWSINKELEHYLRIYGSDGTILVGWKESKFKRAGESAWTPFGSGYDKLSAFRKQIENFAGSIAGRQTLELSATDAVASVEVIASAYEALRASRWEKVQMRLDSIPAPTRLEAAR